MRTDIVSSGVGELSYEIREIVKVAKRAENSGLEIVWENIGDPIAKGEKLPHWIKEIVAETAMEDSSYGYCPTKGLLETREFLADLNNSRNGANISSEDILFFNGLGDAITNIYGLLRKECRVIGPKPAYSTHSSAEGLHANCHPVMYELNKDDNWNPDIEDLTNKIKYNPSIAGILLINPGNPTGAVYSKKVLSNIVDIANEYDLFILTDEIYSNIVYNGKKHNYLSEVIDDVSGISLKGISKDLPWPGSRCGWAEFYNVEKDPIFHKYVENICKFKMIEVCSTTLPQKVIPRVMSDNRYGKYLEERKKHYEYASNYVYDRMKKIEGVTVNKTNGAFYNTLVLEKEYLNEDQSLKIEDNGLKNYIETISKGIPNDKRFVYYLLGSTGICTVPLTSFCSEHNGLRFTLLERNMEIMNNTFEIMAEKIEEYILSN
ncbi:aminotransferase class I and II [Methanococcus vannielii SB]|uniref:Aminotransferase class I and II n=1 Tax=Methanococcus vannielii (strain ATCC 35089 / DSM 1224 / JCM 13029 / OCM 148 / SB) TaxID=406327 RepID=A6UQ41_METVS|nr:pyridoxal phosphate-dependent aminotransferase [Methanococcus vannielii]ABR54613.1 aminotransferase class I and II [Methanococcus vannielii SB]